MANEEQLLIEKLRKIENLHARTSSGGERRAASDAADRVRTRLDEVRAETAMEFQFTFPDAWAKSLFLALLRRNGLRPYRYPRQRRTTVMVRGPRRVIDGEIWPEYQALHETLHEYLSDVTRRVIATAIHGDVSEPELENGPVQLPESASAPDARSG